MLVRATRGLESTIVKIEPGDPKPTLRILRAGPVTKEQLQRFGKVELRRPPVF